MNIAKTCSVMICYDTLYIVDTTGCEPGTHRGDLARTSSALAAYQWARDTGYEMQASNLRPEADLLRDGE